GRWWFSTSIGWGQGGSWPRRSWNGRCSESCSGRGVELRFGAAQRCSYCDGMGVESAGDRGGRTAEEAGLTTRGVSPPTGVPERSLTRPLTTISRYVVLEEIGRGGMGRVLRAYDPKLQREVAVKEVRRAILDEEMTQRLIVEARAMARLSHPNVVSVYDVEVAETGTVVLVMELVSGMTLQRWLAERTRTWQDASGRRGGDWRRPIGRGC